MKNQGIILLAVVASLPCWAGQPSGQTSVVIGQPSIFWHNGEWETYKDGVWMCYGTESNNRFSQPSGHEGAAVPGSPVWSYGKRNSRSNDSKIRPAESNAGLGQTTIGIAQPNGLGQRSTGIGRPNVGMGRPTIGIGQPNVGIGQPNGIGQTTIGIGQPTIGIGKSNGGIGQPNIGIGHPNGIGQTTIGIGKPANFPDQQHSSTQDTTR